MELLIQVTVDPVRPTIHPVGDVIAVLPIGHRWGKEEIAHPNWRIVRVPGMEQHEADALSGPEIPRKHGQTIRLRGMTVDVIALGLPSIVRDPKRHSDSSVEAVLNHASFRAVASVKPVVR